MNTYGVVPTSLIEDPAWIALSVNAKVVYVTCESCRWNTPAGIFVYHVAVLAQSAGLTLDETEAALAELETSFIIRDDRILWLRRHLGQRPGLSIDNENHKIAVRNIIAALPPGSVVVRKYRKHHKSWWRSHPDGPRKPSPGLGDPPTGTGSIAGTGSEKLKAITPAVADSDSEANENSPTREPRQPSPSAPEGLATAGSGIVGESNNVNPSSEGSNGAPTRRDAEARDKAAAALADYQRNFPNDGRRPA